MLLSENGPQNLYIEDFSGPLQRGLFRTNIRTSIEDFCSFFLKEDFENGFHDLYRTFFGGRDFFFLKTDLRTSLNRVFENRYACVCVYI